MNKPALQILNASAGSGKTYRLVKEYIKLLIHDGDVQNTFSGIIAMTFTNKAALEMKERIIEALDAISKEDGSKEDLSKELASELNIKQEEVIKRCSASLEGILHRYEDFNVMTIDKFNLRLIKSFSHDLDLPSDFEVVLDETEIIEKIVDDLLNQLDKSGDGDLNKLLLSYAKNNIDEGISWNYRRNLIEFASILKSERNSSGIKKLMEMNLSLDTYKGLITTKTNLDTKYRRYCQDISDELDHLNSSFLPGGGHTINDIQSITSKSEFPVQTELIKSRLQKNLGSVEGDKIIPQKLKKLLFELNDFWQENIQNYAANDLFKKNFYNMALLQYMAKALEATKKEEQIIRISEFNTLISQLIQEESAPFIYERLGTRFKHFLLDEFQDTSHLQWLNLVPLIYESISQEYRNLIVGDPKQSIYRFKNGVAEQFVALPEIYNPASHSEIAKKSTYFKSMGHVAQLDQNWRSSPTIVKFNNDFFEEFKTKMPPESIDFYNSIVQEPKATKNGTIHIYSKEEKVDSKDLIPIIIKWIEECKQSGFKESEICILGGRNKECNNWAIGLNDAGYRVVSADSLLIHSSLKVQLCISYLYWRLRPNGENEKKRFAELYFRIRSESYDDYKKYIKENKTKEGRTFRYFDDRTFLSDHFGGYESFFFKYESTYDLIQLFFELADFQELENPYLHHLADLMHDFGLKRGPNLKAFLEEYERKKDKIAVQIPEAEDAIKIMTIHKSKGLEFPVVLIPTFDFSMEIKSSFLVGIEGYMVYKSPNQKEVLQPMIDLYNREKSQIITDNINLCYVAMTRPVERLYVHNSFDKKNFGSLFHDTLNATGKAKDHDGALVVELNDGSRSIDLKKKEGASLFEPDDINDRLWFPDIAFQDNEDLNSKDYLSEERQFGIQFHYLISRIESEASIDHAIKSALDSGEISQVNVTELHSRLKELLNTSEYSELLHGAVQQLNEQSIISDESTTLRPDKIIIKQNATVVVDYKTGVPNAKDEKQVLNYKSVLEKMGYPNVCSYLFYTSIHELRKIG